MSSKPAGRSLTGSVATIATLVMLALVVVVGITYALSRLSTTKYSALFSSAIAIYPNSDVRILGVPVGAVDLVVPQGNLVRVDFHLKTGVKVPADVKAVSVAPTVVADRYLQLTPVYAGGPTLAPGAVIPRARTAAPEEFDDLLAAANRLSTSLGPQGANNKGALSQALTTVARNLNGNGKQLNTTLDNASQAITTLSASRDDLAGTVRGLQSFTTNLKQNDGQVRAFTQQFAQVSGYLAGERKDLGQTLDELSTVLGEVSNFVRDNRSEIRTNVNQLSDVLRTVNANRLQLDQVLDTAQFGLDGLVNGFNASSGTLDTRVNLLPTLLCSIFNALPPNLRSVVNPMDPLVPGGVAACIKLGTIGIPPIPASALTGLRLPAARVPAGLSTLSTNPLAPAGTPRDGVRSSHEPPLLPRFLRGGS